MTFKLEGALENIKTKDSQIEELEERIHEMENDKSNLELDVENLTTELTELKHNIRVMEAENNVLSENLTRSSSKANEKVLI